LRFIFFFLLFPISLFCANTSPFVIILTDAGALDYSGSLCFLKTCAKHPSNWSKRGDAGHAWIYLKGEEGSFEGGHSGELGGKVPTYFEEVMHLAAKGDPNPVRCFFYPRPDGYFEEGSGGHCPTYAAKFALNKEQYEAILKLVGTYDFTKYALTSHQCTTFVCQVAALAGIQLDSEVTLHIDRTLVLGGNEYLLWTDPKFASVRFESPDQLEASLKQEVKNGRGEDVTLEWKKRKQGGIKHFMKSLVLFPGRIYRLIFLSQ
jgi:hypothetical protein